MTPQLIVRLATAGDIPSMIEVARSAAGSAIWTAEAYDRRMRDENGISLVGEVAGEIAGLVVVKIIGEECEIENLAVRPEQQRQGYGQKLLTAVLDNAGRKGCRSAWLEVRESNTGARAFYDVAGFQKTGRRRGYYDDPKEDALLLTKTLECPKIGR
jgi:ribosomal-protein-alanine N-acetyltransferase